MKKCKYSKDTEIVKIDWDKSTNSAVRKKSQLENKGYNLICTKQTGLNKFELHYKK